jgi:uncharacterized protein (TIGR02145 family)
MASTAEAIERVYQWGELSKKVDVLEYKKSVEGNFSGYLQYSFYGGEYAPMWNDGKFSKYAIESMNEIIKKYPASRAAVEFKLFIEVLKVENFERTAGVEDYRFLIGIGNHTSTIFKDNRDGKIYKTVKIGNQTWMAHNLNHEDEGSMCYENEAWNCNNYGRLYPYTTATFVCPAGWHLPTYEEWHTLLKTVGDNAGSKLKMKPESWDGTDQYGFSAMPGGYADWSSGNCRWEGEYQTARWWCATDEYSKHIAWFFHVNKGEANVTWNTFTKTGQFSVRCVKD